MSISAYYNGRFNYERRNSNPPVNGQYSYDAPFLVRAFRRKKVQVIKNGLSQNIQSNATYATEEVKLRTGDKIDGMIIIATDDPDTGSYRYWRAYV